MLTTPNQFAFDPAGRVYVVACGKELRVHRGVDDTLVWRHLLPAAVVGVAAGGDTVVTLESSGRVAWRSRVVNTVLETTQVPESREEPTALAATPDAQTCAVIAGDVVWVFRRDAEPVRIDAPGATALAFAHDGSRLAIGDGNGLVRILTAGGEPYGAATTPDAVTSLCWSSSRYWVATAHDAVYRFGPNGGVCTVLTHAPGMSPSNVCIAHDGSVLAVQLTNRLAMAITLPGRKTAVQLTYLDRAITGLAFGPTRRLGVGLSGGAANVVDVTAGELRRSEQTGTWHVRAAIHPEVFPDWVPAEIEPVRTARLWQSGRLTFTGFGVLVMATGLLALVLR